MAGIYLHIPFCKQLCGYCDFYKVISFQQKYKLLEAMKKEIILQKNYLNEPIETIYLGGGTPSTLEVKEIESLLKTIYLNYHIASNVEFTIEANPDDLTPEYLWGLKDIGVNRLSIGIQSFDDKVLKFMNRRHTSIVAIKSVENATKIGFDNLSLDIIYGIPGTDTDYLSDNLKILTVLKPKHISAYHLTIEQNTPFAYLKKKGKIQEISDKNSEAQYSYLVDYLNMRGYEQYEISNFSKDNHISKHNTSYWMQKKYLGIGPSAHSYDKKSRHWNINNIRKYSNSLNENSLALESEILTTNDRFNDYVMVKLRTKWGISLEYISQQFDEKYIKNILNVISKNPEDFIITDEIVILKPEAYLRSNYLISKFFVI